MPFFSKCAKIWKRTHPLWGILARALAYMRYILRGPARDLTYIYIERERGRVYYQNTRLGPSIYKVYSQSPCPDLAYIYIERERESILIESLTGT